MAMTIPTTVSQFEWRWKMLNGEKKFAVINVTCPDRNELAGTNQEKYFNKKHLILFLSNRKKIIMRSINLNNGRLTWISLLLAIPTTCFLGISVLKFEVGINAPYDAISPFLERTGIACIIGLE